MKNPLNPLWSLALGLFFLQATSLGAQQAAPQPDAAPARLAQEVPNSNPGTTEEDEELEWMLDNLFLASQTIGMDEADLFSALAHGLSMAEVARAHGLNPVEILDIALSFEESDILDELLQEEIDLGDAGDWRDEAAEDSAWLIYQEDPFGLEEIVWVLDGAAEACDLDMLELADWLSEGVSMEQIASEMEVELDELSDYALDYLEETIDVLLLLEEIDEDEADAWLGWSEEILDEILADEALFETLADEAWAEEMVEILAGLMGMEADALWDLLDEEVDLQALLESHEIEIKDEKLADEIDDFLDWWNDDDFEEEENANREDF